MVNTLKTPMLAVLKRIGLYDRVKASRLYDVYWTIADKRVIEARRAELAFYRQHLRGFRAGDLIFDIGANQGYKTDLFLRLGATVVAIEPDFHSQLVLKRRFLSYRLSRPRVTVSGVAVSDHDGIATMWLDAPGSAKNTLNEKWVDVLRHDAQRFGAPLSFSTQQQVETTCLETLIRRYGEPFFIKIDVEGHEPRILHGLHRPVRYLSFEVNLPEFRSEGQTCIELLGRLAPRGRFNYAIDCRHGFALDNWVDKKRFLSAFSQCMQPSVEIFWSAGD